MQSGGDVATKVVTVVLIVLMSVTTFTTQRQLMRKNLPDSALDNPFMKQQNVILYLMPVFFAFSGINFPIGVLLYWLTTNLWSMGQQFYVIRRMPAPGSAAERALQARQERRGKSYQGPTVQGLAVEDAPPIEGPVDPPSRQRQQPMGKKRAKKQAPGKPPGAPNQPGGSNPEDSPQDTT
jgi:YidC/Oxa1 family membrane protein insertase